MDERSRHRQFEDDLIAQLRTHARALLGGKLPADTLYVEPTGEGIDAVRGELARLRVYDRDALEKLAGTRAVEFVFQRSRLGGLLRRNVARIRLRTLAPIESMLRNEPAGPRSREDVLDALAHYQVLPRRARPDVVVLASATGFSPEARSVAEVSDHPRVILLGARADGGWDVALPAGLPKTPWARLFELETRDDRIRRLVYHLEQNSAAMDSRGLSVRELAERLGVSEAEAAGLVRQACRRDARLFTVEHNGRQHVCRSPLAEEGDKMSIWSRIRRLLRMKPTPAEQVRELTAQRARVEQQRFELDQRVELLEGQERQIVEQGAKAASDAERKQLAGKLVRVRRELSRARSQAQVLTNQIDIVGTQIHHVTLREQGKRVALPSAEELTREAAAAEQVMTELSANAELARGIEVNAETPQMAAEEAAIFEEFKAAAAGRESQSAGAVPASERSRGSAGPARASDDRIADAADPGATAEPPPPPRREGSRTRPELS